MGEETRMAGCVVNWGHLARPLEESRIASPRGSPVSEILVNFRGVQGLFRKNAIGLGWVL